MFVLMLQGYPITASLPEDLGLGDRFWYWRGISGRAYIHSIYPAACCPPLPGAIYILVKRLNGIRLACAVGRFHASGGKVGIPAIRDCDEVHVHLLAREDAMADEVRRDLAGAFGGGEMASGPACGFSEVDQRIRLAA